VVFAVESSPLIAYKKNKMSSTDHDVAILFAVESPVLLAGQYAFDHRNPYVFHPLHLVHLSHLMIVSFFIMRAAIYCCPFVKYIEDLRPETKLGVLDYVYLYLIFFFVEQFVLVQRCVIEFILNSNSLEMLGDLNTYIYMVTSVGQVGLALVVTLFYARCYDWGFRSTDYNRLKHISNLIRTSFMFLVSMYLFYEPIRSAYKGETAKTMYLYALRDYGFSVLFIAACNVVAFMRMRIILDDEERQVKKKLIMGNDTLQII
jgi:hypothetical protein